MGFLLLIVGGFLFGVIGGIAYIPLNVMLAFCVSVVFIVTGCYINGYNIGKRVRRS